MPEQQSIRRAGAVVMLDALGTKGAWQRVPDPSKLAADRARWLQDARNRVEKDSFVRDTLARLPPGHVVVFDWECMSFSDTFIITASSPAGQPIHWQLFHQLRNVLAELFAHAIISGVAFRGAVTVGDFYRADSVLLGPAVDEVAEWYEKTDWVGVHLTPSAAMWLDRVDDGSWGFRDSFFPEWRIPMKGGKEIAGRTVSWPTPSGVEGHTLREMLADILLVPPVLEDVERKYRSTLNFYDWIMKQSYPSLPTGKGPPPSPP